MKKPMDKHSVFLQHWVVPPVVSCSNFSDTNRIPWLKVEDDNVADVPVLHIFLSHVNWQNFIHIRHNYKTQNILQHLNCHKDKSRVCNLSNTNLLCSDQFWISSESDRASWTLSFQFFCRNKIPARDKTIPTSQNAWQQTTKESSGNIRNLIQPPRNLTSQSSRQERPTNTAPLK